MAVLAADASRLEYLGQAFNEFFEGLELPRCYGDDQSHRFKAVLGWLRKHSQWLLIFDNLQQRDYAILKRDFFLQGNFRHVIITTRSEWAGRTFGGGASNLSLHVDKLQEEAAKTLLLKSSQLESRCNKLELQPLA